MSEGPTVVVWRRAWLPASETFVRNQFAALKRWRGIALGAVRIDSPLSSPSDITVFENTVWGAIEARLFRVTGASRRVRKEIRSAAPDLVHAHFVAEALSIARIVRSERVPMVVTAHGHDVTAAPRMPGWRGALYRWRARRLFKSASLIIAVSQFIKERLLELGAPEHKIRVHFIGIPTNVSCERDDETEWDVVFVGRLVAKKGVEDMLRAIAELGPRDEPVRLAIVGDGPERVRLEAVAQSLGVDASFLGALPPDAVRRVLSRAALFCGPSKQADDGDSEGFGMVFLEAALAGLPVVAYRHGGVSESVVDGVTGLLGPEGDVRQLSRNIARLLDDSSLAEAMGAAGRARVLEDFDVVKQTAELESLYDSVLAAR